MASSQPAPALRRVPRQAAVEEEDDLIRLFLPTSCPALPVIPPRSRTPNEHNNAPALPPNSHDSRNSHIVMHLEPSSNVFLAVAYPYSHQQYSQSRIRITIFCTPWTSFHTLLSTSAACMQSAFFLTPLLSFCHGSSHLPIFRPSIISCSNFFHDLLTPHDILSAHPQVGIHDTGPQRVATGFFERVFFSHPLPHTPHRRNALTSLATIRQ